jgi:hypothetical protein
VKRPELWLGAAVVAFGAFVGLQIGRAPKRATPKVVADTTDTLETMVVEAPEGALIRVRRSALPPPPPRDYPAIALLIAEGRGVTYMDEILSRRGGNVARWVDRRENPITVWIQRNPGVRDFWPNYPDLARDAFYTWSSAGIPVKFLFIEDSASAEVHVRWVEKFNDSAAGKTFWARDQNWWILGGDIELALHSPAGQAYDRDAVHAIAIHEVGHLIGLDHSSNTENVMAPKVHVLRLSAEDLRTAHLVYKLPPGRVAAPATSTAK